MNEISRQPAPTREQFRGAPSSSILDAVIAATGTFDPDAWHVMDRRDNALIADEIMHGSGSNKFVYSFSMPGGAVSGISVVGARHLAAHYGGIKHRMVATMQKTGSLFTFTSYPAENMPMSVSCSTVPELAHEPDFFQAVVEITDVKKGNTIQVEKRENRFEVKRNGESYERNHYATIAQSKAYRNGVLAVIPQDVQIEWKAQMLKLGASDVITGSVIEEKRSAVLRFAAGKAIALDRHAIEALTMDQIAGLSDAAREGKLPQFVAAAQALGLVQGEKVEDKQPEQEKPPAKAATTKVDPKPTAAKSEPAKAEPPAVDCYLADAFGEIAEWRGKSHFTDPVAFAEALIGIWEASPAEQRRAVWENNADAIGDASAASQRASELLKAAQPQPESEENGLVLKVPQSGRGPDLVAYVTKAREAVQALDTEGRIAEWEQANLPTYGKFPSSKKLEVMKLVAERRAVVAAQPEEEKPADAAPTASDVEHRGRLFLEDARKSNGAGLAALQNNPVYQRTLVELETVNPDLKEAIVGAMKHRADELRRGKDEPPPNMDVR